MTVRPWDHLDIVAHGALPRGEVWSCGLVAAGAAPVTLANDPAKMDTSASQATARWGTFLAGSLPIGAGVTLSGVTVYLRKANTTKAELVSAATYTGTQPGGTVAMPNQVAMVASLRSGSAGRSARSRIYVPVLGITPVPAGSTVVNLGTALATLIAGLNTDLSSTWGLAMGIWAGSTGGLVTRILTDDVPDTQRRRRDKVVPGQVASATVPAG